MRQLIQHIGSEDYILPKLYCREGKIRMKEVLGIIPARSGSKTIKDKNIRLIDGKPMLAYSIEHAKAANSISRIIVSTDSEMYAQIAYKYGAEIPFLRPKEIAGDSSLDIETFGHALAYLREKEGYVPDYVVQLRPTYPIRNPNDIDNMIRIIDSDVKIDSVRCIVPAKEIAYKMWREKPDGTIEPILRDIPEAYNMPRQKLPIIYYQNACIDVIRTSVITEKHSMSGDIIVPYKLEHNYDIDTEEDFICAETAIMIQSGSKRFVFDIDGVITTAKKSLDYSNAEPNRKMIAVINKLHKKGNEIILFTARGYKTGIDWQELTRKQMDMWGVEYDELKFGKPNADFYIDDKMVAINALYRLLEKD